MTCIHLRLGIGAGIGVAAAVAQTLDGQMSTLQIARALDVLSQSDDLGHTIAKAMTHDIERGVSTRESFDAVVQGIVDAVKELTYQ